MEKMKITYIGAGSFRFSTFFFMEMSLMSAELGIELEVGLCDIDKKSLSLMEKYFKAIAEKAKRKKGAKIKITTSIDRRELLEGSDFVYKSISVGIQQSEWFDIYLPLKFGIPQNTGDTVGPGGVFRGLRVAPVCYDIAKDMKELCPKAPLLSYTNPQAACVMAARTASPDIQFIGLCHELFGGSRTITDYFNKYYADKIGGKIGSWEDLRLRYGGVNHFVWYTDISYNDKDLYPYLRERAGEMVLKKKYRPFNMHLLERFGYYPYPGSRHVAEFIPEYYNYFNYKVQTPYWSFPVVRDVQKLAKMRKWAYRIMKWASTPFFYTPPARKTGEKAMDMTIEWLKSIEHGESKIEFVANLPNTGSTLISNLPKDSIVEVPTRFKNGILEPVETITLPEDIAGLIRPHAEQQRLTVDAAISNDPDKIIKAMLHDPMNKFIEDDDKIEYLTQLMLYYEQQWLPEDWKEWIPSKEELMKNKWWIGPQDLIIDYDKYLEVKFPPRDELKKKAFFWKND